jgi:hypothetical protein
VDPNSDGPLKIIITDKHINITGTKPLVVDLNEPCQIEYQNKEYAQSVASYEENILLAGSLNNNYRCNVIIDTGCPHLCALSPVIVQENNLPIYPIDGDEYLNGISYLSNLKLGKLVIHEMPCWYADQQWELQFFGIPIKKDKTITLGLMLMKEFRYISFDGVHRKLTLSAEQSFMPTQDDQWSRYPLKIEDDTHGALRLMVDIPIEGKTYHIALDTGSPDSLTIDRKFFDEFYKSEKVAIKKQDAKLGYYAEGWVNCQKITLPELDFCHRKIKNAQIFIRPDDMANKYPNIVGMKYFKDTVLVLDFENELLWVKDKEIVEK